MRETFRPQADQLPESISRLIPPSVKNVVESTLHELQPGIDNNPLDVEAVKKKTIEILDAICENVNNSRAGVLTIPELASALNEEAGAAEHALLLQQTLKGLAQSIAVLGNQPDGGTYESRALRDEDQEE